MKWAIPLLFLVGCGSGGTHTEKPVDCEKLMQQCRFNGNAEKCRTKQSPGQAERYRIYFETFCRG